MASDTLPGDTCGGGPYEASRAARFHPTRVAEAEQLFAALGEGGTVIMPLEKTFWAERFGMLTDRLVCLDGQLQ